MKSETQCVTRVAVCGTFLITVVVGAPVLGMGLKRGVDYLVKDQESQGRSRFHVAC